MTTLSAFLISITSSLTMRVMTSLGIGFVSYAAITTAVNSLTQSVNTSLNSMDTDILGILNLAGLGTCLSILTSALIARAALLSIKQLQPL